MRSRISVVALVAALAGVLFLAGCGEDEGQAPLDESTMDGLASSMGSNLPSSDEPSDEPSEEETFDPAKETAREFIQRWQAVSAQMQETGDVADFRELHGDQCSSCDGLVERVEAIHAKGGEIDVPPVEIIGFTRDTKHQWTVRIRSDGTVVRESAGVEEEQFSGGEYTYIVTMGRDADGAWQLVEYLLKDE